MSNTIDSKYTTMERAEKAQAPDCINQIIVVVICIILFIIFCLKKVQQQNDLKVACKFVGYITLNVCTEAESFVIERVMTAGILSTIPSKIGLLTQMIALAISDDTVLVNHVLPNGISSGGPLRRSQH